MGFGRGVAIVFTSFLLVMAALPVSAGGGIGSVKARDGHEYQGRQVDLQVDSAGLKLPSEAVAKMVFTTFYGKALQMSAVNPVSLAITLGLFVLFYPNIAEAPTHEDVE